jgi:predicted small secreted protein
MKKNPSFFLLFIIVISFCGCAKKEVNGEVIILDEKRVPGEKGTALYKFGLVTVYFLTQEQYKIATDTNSTQYRENIEQLNNKDSTENYIIWMARYNQVIAERNRFIKSYKEHSNIYGLIDASWIEYSDNALKRAKEYVRFTTDKRAERGSIQYFIDSVRQDVISVLSDSDGKFKIGLKNIKYWVFANATLQSSASKEYHWLFEYIPNEDTLLLSNENMK